jgi:hypothetical protein
MPHQATDLEAIPAAYRAAIQPAVIAPHERANGATKCPTLRSTFKGAFFPANLRSHWTADFAAVKGSECAAHHKTIFAADCPAFVKTGCHAFFGPHIGSILPTKWSSFDQAVGSAFRDAVLAAYCASVCATVGSTFCPTFGVSEHYSD